MSPREHQRPEKKKRCCCIFHDNEMSSQGNRVVFLFFLVVHKNKKVCFFQGLFLLFLVRVLFFIFTYFRSPFFSVSLPHFVYFHPKKGNFCSIELFFRCLLLSLFGCCLFSRATRKKKTIFCFIRKIRKKNLFETFFLFLPKNFDNKWTNKQKFETLFICTHVSCVCVCVSVCVCSESHVQILVGAHTGTKKNAIFSCTSLLLTTVSPFSLSPLFFSKKKYSPKPFTFFFLCFYFLSAAFKLKKNKQNKQKKWESFFLTTKIIKRKIQ